MTQALPYACLVGSGSFLPPRLVSNDALAADLATRQIETSDEWIVERTGIRQRYLADKGMTTSALATEAAQRALADAGVQASELDLIIVATSTPDLCFRARHAWCKPISAIKARPPSMYKPCAVVLFMD